MHEVVGQMPWEVIGGGGASLAAVMFYFWRVAHADVVQQRKDFRGIVESNTKALVQLKSTLQEQSGLLRELRQCPLRQCPTEESKK